MPGNDPDLYAVLGVPPTASAAELTAVYRRLLLALHHDTRPVGTPAGDATADARNVLHRRTRSTTIRQCHPAGPSRACPSPRSRRWPRVGPWGLHSLRTSG